MPEHSSLSPRLPGTPGAEDSRPGAPPVQIDGLHFDRPPSLPAAPRGATRGTARGFAISALLHAALLLALLLLMAPIAGTVGQITLRLTAPQPKEELEMVRSIDVPAAAQPPLGPQHDAPALLPDNLLALPAAPSRRTNSGGGAELGPGHGSSFFGTEAAGRDFVYVVDISGSMQARGGRRLERAKQELIHSIGRLTDDQRFYVYAFNGETHPMFGDHKNQGSLVHATSHNKQRLTEWVLDLEPSGSTDPRMAIHLGLSLAPDALFLLSDGEFRTGGSRTTEWPRKEDRVADVVMGFGTGRIPIHTISYEDQQNQLSMRELAGLTGGNHTFVPRPGEGPSLTVRPSDEPLAIARATPAILGSPEVADPFGAEAHSRSQLSGAAFAVPTDAHEKSGAQRRPRGAPTAARTAGARTSASTAFRLEQARYGLAVARALLNVGRWREAEEIVDSLDGLPLTAELEQQRSRMELEVIRLGRGGAP